MANNEAKVLIVGAGPVGLAAGLFLAKKGVKPRIVEKLLKPAEYSKALGVNARSLELLESVGATEIFLQNGHKLTLMNVLSNNSVILKNDITLFKHKYSFILMQRQSESEAIFANLLSKQGIHVERGVELISVKNIDNGVQVELKHQSGDIECTKYDLVYAADGAHSAVRKSLGLGFNGDTYPDPFYLADVELTSNLNSHEAYLNLYNDSFQVMLPIKNNVWRLFSNSPKVLELLPPQTKIENITWKAEFRISHRIIDRFSVGNVYFGGDSAHIHAPIGGRGMNAGIEDAYVFAQLFEQNKLALYHEERNKVIKQLISQIHWMGEVLNGSYGKAWLIRKLIPYVAPIALYFGRQSALSFMLGLDHDI